MKDILGRDIKVGDIVARGHRSGAGGGMSINLVLELRDDGLDNWNSQEIKVIGYSDRKWVYDKETRNGEYKEGFYMNDRGGWTFPDRVVVITEVVPASVREFLQGQL